MLAPPPAARADTDGEEYEACINGCSGWMVYNDYQQLPGPILGFHVYAQDINAIRTNQPVEVHIVYNSCPCPVTSFNGGEAPSDMTAQVLGSGLVSQTLQYQRNLMESNYPSITCGSYSLEF